MSASDVTEAVNLFLMRKFDQCFRECNDIIKTAKCEPEQERNQKLIEAATALGIQALAETDMWYCAIAFITEVYGMVEMCPSSIIQLCILLHAQVKEYLPCHKIVEMWLSNPYNQKSKQHVQVIRTYAYHILCPAGSYNVLRHLVENCDSLTESEKTTLLQISETKTYEESRLLGSKTTSPAVPDSSKSNVTEPVSENHKVNNKSTMPDSSDETLAKSETPDNSMTRARNKAFSRIIDLSKMRAVLRWLYESVVIKLKPHFHHSRFTLFLMGIFAVWALIETQSGETVSSLGRFVIMWRAFLQRLGLLTRS